jgi:hypothetical protein
MSRESIKHYGKNRLLKRPRFQNFCPSSLQFTSSKLLKYQGENELLKHMESPWISILINLVRIKPRKTDGIRKHQHHSNYKTNQTPSSIP